MPTFPVINKSKPQTQESNTKAEYNGIVNAIRPYYADQMFAFGPWGREIDDLPTIGVLKRTVMDGLFVCRYC